MSPAVVMRRRRVALRAIVIALVWSLGLVLAAVLVPTVNGETSSPSTGVTLTQVTLVQSKGLWALALVLIPVVVAALCLAATVAPADRDVEVVAGSSTFHVRTPRESVRQLRRIACAAVAVVWVESILGILSIGAYLLPVAALLTVGLALGAPRRERTRRRVAAET